MRWFRSNTGSIARLALFALSFFAVYDFSRWLAHQRAVAILNARVYQGGPPIRVAAFPASSANPLAWSGWIERPEFVKRFALNLGQDFDPTAGTTIYKAQPSPAIDAARSAHPVQVLLNFAQYPLWRVSSAEQASGSLEVDLRDWRFPFTASVTGS